jgi:hypothetical protein
LRRIAASDSNPSQTLSLWHEVLYVDLNGSEDTIDEDRKFLDGDLD